MMGTEMVPETSVIFTQLTRLTAREDIISVSGSVSLLVIIGIPNLIVAVGGLVVSVLATGPKVAGSNPAEDDGF
jgi:hypothetical protein